MKWRKIKKKVNKDMVMEGWKGERKGENKVTQKRKVALKVEEKWQSENKYSDNYLYH